MYQEVTIRMTGLIFDFSDETFPRLKSVGILATDKIKKIFPSWSYKYVDSE
jgi:hypothetical protein